VLTGTVGTAAIFGSGATGAGTVGGAVVAALTLPFVFLCEAS